MTPTEVIELKNEWLQYYKIFQLALGFGKDFVNDIHSSRWETFLNGVKGSYLR